jgi:hypothetical protein
MIMNETNIIDKYIDLLNSLPSNKLINCHIEPLYRLSCNLPNEYNKILYNKGMK